MLLQRTRHSQAWTEPVAWVRQRLPKAESEVSEPTIPVVPKEAWAAWARPTQMAGSEAWGLRKPKEAWTAWVRLMQMADSAGWVVWVPQPERKKRAASEVLGPAERCQPEVWTLAASEASAA